MALEAIGRPEGYLRPEPLNRLTQATALANDPATIYDSALVCLRESLDVTRSSILLFDEDGVMRFKAWSGLSETYREAVEGHSPWTPDTQNPSPVLVQDVRQEQSLSPLLGAIEAEQIRGLAFVPLFIGTRLLGKFMLYYDEPHVFTADEIAVAQTIASQVAFAIDQQEHRLHLEALRESEETLRDFFENAPVAMDWLAPDGRIIRANQAELHLLGYSEDEYLGRNTADFHVNPAAIADILARLAKGEAVQSYEARLRRKDGAVKHVLIDSSGLWRDGSLVHARCFTRDITQRKQAEERRDLYEEIFRHSFDGIAIIDPTGRYLEQNEAHRELTGFSDDELMGATPAIHLGDEVFSRVVEELSNTGRFRGDVVSISKQGEEHAIDLAAFAVRDESGEVRCYVGMKRDITERRHTEEAAYRLAAIVESSEDAIVGKNLDGIVTSWNPGAERLFGYRADEMVGNSIRKIIPADRQHEEDLVLARIHAGEHVDHFDTVRQSKSGRMIDVSLSISPVRDREGRIIGASKIARDVSERKAAEEAIRQSAALKDQFLSLISHELRTPLSTIYGSSRLLHDRFAKIGESDRQQLLEDIVAESARLQRIIENLLLLTRLEAGGLELEPVALGLLVDKVVSSFQSRNPSREVILKRDLDGVIVLGNPTYIEMALENFVANAAKYSDRETAIEVQLHSDGRVQVLDRGIGLANGDEGQLFTPFFRTQAARNWASGMGVGLAVCKRVIEAMGGSIWALPREGGGAEFGFALQPLPDAERAD